MKDSLGRYRTTSLFWEHRSPHYPYLWVLGEEDVEKDGKVVPSLKRLYLSYDHIPGFEYEFVQDLFGSWEHWQRLLESPEVSSHIQRWRDELEIKNRTKQFRLLMKSAEQGDMAAAKFLVDKLDPAPKRGRPSKAEKEMRLKQTTEEKKEMDEIQSRVLSLVERKKAK